MKIEEAIKLSQKKIEEREIMKMQQQLFAEIQKKDEIHKQELSMSKKEKEKRCRKMWNEYMEHSEAKEYFAPPKYTALYEYFDLYTSIINPTSAVQIPIRIAMELKFRPEDEHTKYPTVLLEVDKRYNALQHSDAKYLYYVNMYNDGWAAIVNITSVNSTWERKWMPCQKDSNTDEKVLKDCYLIPNNECKWFRLNDK